MGQHTVEKIGGTSMTRFGELMENILIGSRRGAELYNRILRGFRLWRHHEPSA